MNYAAAAKARHTRNDEAANQFPGDLRCRWAVCSEQFASAFRKVDDLVTLIHIHLEVSRRGAPFQKPLQNRPYRVCQLKLKRPGVSGFAIPEAMILDCIQRIEISR